MQTLRIGRVARESGISIEAIRFYEQEGLLPKPARALSGYRNYQPEAIVRLRFIRHAKELGFSLREVRELLSLRVERGTTCGQVREQAQHKIADIEQRIKKLARMKQALDRLSAACSGRGPTRGCPILDALENEET